MNNPLAIEDIHRALEVDAKMERPYFNQFERWTLEAAHNKAISLKCTLDEELRLICANIVQIEVGSVIVTPNEISNGTYIAFVIYDKASADCFDHFGEVGFYGMEMWPIRSYSHRGAEMWIGGYITTPKLEELLKYNREEWMNDYRKAE